MSLLEDIYGRDEDGLDGDIERIIEGDEDIQEDRNSDEDDRNSHSEAEEEQPRKVEPQAEKKAKVIKNPRFVLNPARLMGPRGISTIEKFFKDVTFKGKGHEKEDLDLVMKKLEHWAHRLYPKYQFDDCLHKIASLGHKKIVQVHMRKIRMNMLYNDDDDIVQQCDSDNDNPPDGPQPLEMDEFDLLLEQQIALARSTPASNMKNSTFNNSHFVNTANKPDLSIIRSPAPQTSPQITDEQKARMMKNRLLAEQRRLERMKANASKELTNQNVSSTFAANTTNSEENDTLTTNNFESNSPNKSTVKNNSPAKSVVENNTTDSIEDSSANTTPNTKVENNAVHEQSVESNKNNNIVESFSTVEDNRDTQSICNVDKEIITDDKETTETIDDKEDEMMDIDDITLNLSE